MTFSEAQSQYYRQGLLDERKCMTVGVMDSYLGEFSCIAAIKGNSLKIYVSDATLKLGTMRHEFAICNLRDVKTRSFFLAPKIQFSYAGKHYTLTRFGDARRFIEEFNKENQGR